RRAEDHDIRVYRLRPPVRRFKEPCVAGRIDPAAPLDREVRLVPNLDELDPATVALDEGRDKVGEVLRVRRRGIRRRVGWTCPGGRMVEPGDDSDAVTLGEGNDLVVLLPGVLLPL